MSDRVESKRNVLFVCDEWNTSRGGLCDDFAIHCYLCQSSESDREDARRNGVNVITAKSIPGTSDRLELMAQTSSFGAPTS